MLVQHERWVGLFEIGLRGKGHPSIPLQFSLAAFDNLRVALEAFTLAGIPLRRQLVEDRLWICLDDMSVDLTKQSAELLFTVCDAAAADAAFRNIKTNKQRIVEKGPDEGGAASAHLVIDFQTEPNVWRYRAALERVPGVSRTRILPFLEELLLAHCGHVKVPTDEGVVQAAPSLLMDSLPAKTLEESLAQGELKGIELVALTRKRRLDDGQAYEEASRTVTFRIPPRTIGERARSLVRAVRADDRYHDLPVIRIRWRRPDGKEQTLSALSADGEGESFMEEAFARIEHINGFYDHPLDMACEELRADLTTKMHELLRSSTQNL